jgi:REP-associated tyrosine transposase
MYRWPLTVSQEIRTGRHCAFPLHAQLVFVTKFRHRVSGDGHLVRLEEILRDVCTDFEVERVEFNGESTHVHLPVHVPPKAALAKLVNSMTGESRRRRQEFPDLVQHYWRAQNLWSASCSAGSAGGAPLDIVKQYIENQNRPPRSSWGAIHLHPEGWSTPALQMAAPPGRPWRHAAAAQAGKTPR